MPKLIKQAFFPCNPHTDVRTAMHYAATATTGAAQSQVWVPARSWVASGTNLHHSLNNGLPPTSGFARKRHPPLHSAAKARDLAHAPSNRGFPLKCQRPPCNARVSRMPRFQQSPGRAGHRFTPGTRQAVGWGGSAARTSLAEEHPRAGDGRWLCWLARVAPGGSTAQRRGLAVLRVR